MDIIDKRNNLERHQSKRYRKRSQKDIKNIAIHHSATASGSAEAFATYHVSELGWPGIGYHYVVNKNGTIDVCHDLESVTFHVGNSNLSAIGICLVGDFRFQAFEHSQKKATVQLVEKLMKDLNLSVTDVWGHMEFPGYHSKQCPSINMNDFRAMLSTCQLITSPFSGFTRQLRLGSRGKDVKQLQQKLKNNGFYGGLIDGIFGRQTEIAVREFQIAEKIQVDGIVGQQTWIRLI